MWNEVVEPQFLEQMKAAYPLVCLNSKWKLKESLQEIGNHFCGSCASLASLVIVLNLIACDDKTSTGIVDLGMRLEAIVGRSFLVPILRQEGRGLVGWTCFDKP